MNPFARPSVCFIAVALAACSGTGTTVPSVPIVPSAFTSRVVQVTAEDRAAARSVSHFSYHIFPVSSRWLAQLPNKTKIIYPADLQYYGGPLMKTAAEHNIYVNCKSKDEQCWGDPEGFLKNLAGSNLIKLLTQYTNAGPGAYTFADGTPVAYTAYSKYYYVTDLLSILHSVAKSHGTGYANEYHIFLPKGVDTCIDGTTICYSPDVPSTWVLCAYHALAAFSDIGPTVFSVEPYQNVRVGGVSCKYPNLPKGYDPLNNFTDSTLAHEMFESITDSNPTPATYGWVNLSYGAEIGDLCAQTPFVEVQKIAKTKYFIQTMYSDKYHACADGP
jgi:hypothetical protein